MTEQHKKYIKIAVIAVLVFAVIYFLYMQFGGNEYASAGTLSKIKKGGFGTWNEWTKPGSKEAFVAVANGIDPTLPYEGATFTNGENYSMAWCKGMGIDPTPENLNTFMSDVKKYVANKSLRKNHWSITVGSFLA